MTCVSVVAFKTVKGAIVTNKPQIALALLASILISGTANASLIGDTVDANWSFLAALGSAAYQDTAVVGGGIEFTSNVPANSGFFDEADIGDSSIQLTYRLVGIEEDPFQAKRWRFTDLDWVGMTGEIVGVIPDPNNPAGASVFTFGPDSVEIDLPTLGVEEGEPVSWRFDLVTRHVPEPATFALFGLGLAGIGVARRRKRPA